MKLLIITYYKLKMMFADRLFFTAMLLIPLFITLSAGYALRYEKLNIIPVAFVDEDQSDYSRTLLERLSAKEGFQIVTAERDKVLKMLKGNEIEEVFIIKKGFEENIKRGENKQIIDLIKSPSSFAADFASEVVAGEVIRFVTGSKAADWVEEQYEKLGKQVGEELYNEVREFADSQWEPGPLMTVEYKELEGGREKGVSRVSLPAATATSAGIIVVFIMFYVLFSSGWLVEERTNGTLKRLVSGPGALGYAFAGSVFALMISGSLLVALFSLINRIVFHVELIPGLWSYVIITAYMLSVVSLSLFLSSVLKTTSQLQAFAPLFTLLTGFAGGCFWNFVEMPPQLKAFSLLTPQGWALDGINRLLVNSHDAAAIVMPVLVLFATALILMPLSYIIIRVYVRN